MKMISNTFFYLNLIANTRNKTRLHTSPSKATSQESFNQLKLN